MDPFGIIAILAGAGWIIGKLNEDKKPPPPPNKPATWQRHSPAVVPVPEYRPSPDRVHVPVKVTKSNAADEAIETWESEGEEAQDSRAFRPIGPLQDLLADHAALVERIAETLDRRLS